ncbi:NusG domain II-containing protein [Mediterraneibacter sp.]|jgi:hypothetical protein|uniref:NusG domain II-containing protein n=1 Tax=Mediterraneibacter sp. TaxID=2316022 RepID=UPI0015A8741E|nr:NusG domain II-containing protein [Mediterraneibacter sp.]
MKKNDKILIVGVLLIALAAFGFQCLRPAGDEAKLKITVDGKLFGTYRLSEEKTVKVNDTNKVLIKDGAVFMEWADCPDQICVRHKRISRNGESIICLPNKVVLSIESEKKGQLDGIAQ